MKLGLTLSGLMGKIGKIEEMQGSVIADLGSGWIVFFMANFIEIYRFGTIEKKEKIFRFFLTYNRQAGKFS